jgi:membrane protease YdiL (CAAX protease family)
MHLELQTFVPIILFQALGILVGIHFRPHARGLSSSNNLSKAISDRCPKLNETFVGIVSLTLIVSVLVPIYEEFVFRYCLLNLTSYIFSDHLNRIVNGLLFIAVHYQNCKVVNYGDLLYKLMFLTGVGNMSYLVLSQNSLLDCILVHGLMNFTCICLTASLTWLSENKDTSISYFQSGNTTSTDDIDAEKKKDDNREIVDLFSENIDLAKLIKNLLSLIVFGLHIYFIVTQKANFYTFILKTIFYTGIACSKVIYQHVFKRLLQRSRI